MMTPANLVEVLRTRRRLLSAELLAALGVSRPTLMRAVRAAGDQVLTIGRSRRTSYAARRALRGRSTPLPVFRIDAEGRPHEDALLHLAYPEGIVLEGDMLGRWPLADEMRDGWFDGLPYMLQDLRPEGFLGRAFAREYATLLQVAEDPRRWSDDDVLHALSLLGPDQSGCYIVGEAAYHAWAERSGPGATAIDDAGVADAYPNLARRAMEHGSPGSSAGGEFPKFTALRSLDGEASHVIVKFSGDDDAPGTQRWSDLLVGEHIASRVVGRLVGLTGCSTVIHRAGGRTFLEVLRFDRHGASGRSPLCSWAALNNAWFGLGGKPWTDAAVRLMVAGLVDARTATAMARLWHFGQLVGNSDMHDGNLSFLPVHEGFVLAPVYDMLPMLYAPQRGVELPERELVIRQPRPSEREAWLDAACAAVEFWRLASTDERISAVFRRISAANASRVEAAWRAVSRW